MAETAVFASDMQQVHDEGQINSHLAGAITQASCHAQSPRVLMEAAAGSLGCSRGGVVFD